MSFFESYGRPCACSGDSYLPVRSDPINHCRSFVCLFALRSAQLTARPCVWAPQAALMAPPVRSFAQRVRNTNVEATSARRGAAGASGILGTHVRMHFG